MRAYTFLPPVATIVGSGLVPRVPMAYRTEYRGTVCLHNSNRWAGHPKRAARAPDGATRAALARLGIRALAEVPLGAVVATVTFTGCAAVPDGYAPDPLSAELFDWASARYLWEVRDARPLDRPVPATGHQIGWELPDRFLPRDRLKRHSIWDNRPGLDENPERPVEDPLPETKTYAERLEDRMSVDFEISAIHAALIVERHKDRVAALELERADLGLAAQAVMTAEGRF